MSRLRRLASSFALLALAPLASAEQFATFGDYDVHYNAFRADFLPPEVATQHGLTRSRDRGLLNITVLRHTEAGATAPSEAALAVTVTSREAGAQVVRMRPVVEDGTLNYLGEFRLQRTDTYRFEIEVTPAGTARAYRIVFSQTLLDD
jgi:hypothetical protein